MITDNLEIFSKSVIINKPIIAIDYGIKSLGCAISDYKLQIAMPLTVIKHSNVAKQIQAIGELLRIHQPWGVVIGLPIMMNGDMSEQAKIVYNFAQELLKQLPTTIYMQDERLTSKAANMVLKDMGLNRKQRTECDDSIAASMILETVLTKMQR